MTRSKAPELTPAQLRALDLTRHTAVSAGAGSGKTFVLTERFVRALERVRREPRPLRRVVAITFSRKATAEMRARVRAAVGDRLRTAARAGDDELVRFWRHVRDQIHTARITTIDAFCASLLRDHPLASNVDPGFDIVEASEARLLAREAVGATLAHISKHAAPDDAALRALTHLTTRYRRREITEMLAAFLADRALAAEWVESLDSSETAIDARVASTGRELDARYREAVERIGARVTDRERRAITAAAAFTGEDKLLGPVRAADAFLRAAAEADADDARFAAAAAELLTPKPSTGTWRARSFGRAGRMDFWGGRNAIAEVRALTGRISRYLEEELWWYAPFDVAVERDGLVAECELATLYSRVERRYRTLVGAPRRLDFAGLTLAAGALVARTDAARRVATEIDHLLVDEFQDTSIAQWRVLERILTASAPEETPDAPPRITVFVVGDEKQAIYEFRGGRVEVFRRVIGRLTEWNGQHVVMDDNFRSLPNPIGVVNDVFAEVFTAASGRDYEAAPQPLSPHRRAPDAEGGPSREGTVELLLSDPGSVSDVDTLREIEADRIALHIRELVDGHARVVDPATDRPRAATWSDIAVIVFYKRLYSNLEGAFAARGIPSRVLGGLGFYQSREVLDASVFLRALTDPRDEIALTALLRSPFANVPDTLLWKISRLEGKRFSEKLAASTSSHDASAPLDEVERRTLRGFTRRLNGWADLLGRIPTSALIDRATRETGYVAATCAMPGGERRVAVIEKLLDVIRRFEARHGIRPVELCEWLRMQTEEVRDEGEAGESGSADGVTLMTIHRAKGTEYPIVIVPGLLDAGHTGDQLPFRRTHDVGGARIGLKIPVDLATYDPTATDMCRTSRFRLLDLSLAERRRAEEKRVLYVAMTRARDRLVLSTRTPLSTARDPSPSAVNTSWTPLDWLRTIGPLEHAMQGTTDDAVSLPTSAVDVRAPVEVTRPEHAPDRTLLDVLDALESGVHEEAEEIGDREPPREPVEAARAQLDLFGTTAARGTSEIRHPRAPAEDKAPLGERTIADEAKPHWPVVLPVTALADLAVDPARFYVRVALGIDPGAHGDGDPDPLAGARGSGATLGRRVHRRLAAPPHARARLDASTSGDANSAEAHVACFLASARAAEAAAATRDNVEIPFVLPTPHGRLDGTIDRLYLGSDGTWTLLDYKTNRLASERSVADCVSRRGYDVQLLLYATAAARILELSPETTMRMVIFFTDPSLRTERELVRDVRVEELPEPEALGSVLRGVSYALHTRGAAAFPAGAVERAPFTFESLTRWGETAP